MRIAISTSLVSARWAILILFVLGYALTASRLTPFVFEYSLCSLVSLGACAALLMRLKRVDKETLAVWLVLCVFLFVYYVRFYLLIIDPSFLRNMLTEGGWNALSRPPALIRGFELATLTFTVFAVVTAFLLPNSKDASISRVTDVSDVQLYEMVGKFLMIIAPALMVVSSYLAWRYGIGQLGSSTRAHLPYRLAGIVFYTRLVLVPALLLLLIHSGTKAGKRWLSNAGVVLMIVHGVMDLAIRSSRAALLMPIMSLVFLALFGGWQLRSVEKRIVGGLFVLAIALIPFTHLYRELRNSGLPFFDAVAQIEFAHLGLYELFRDGFLFLIFRMPGIEMVIATVGSGGAPLGRRAIDVLLSTDGVAGYLTHNVFGVVPGVPDAFATGFVGWFYLIGGTAGIIIGAVITAAIVTKVWSKAIALQCRAEAVILTLGALLLFLMTTEGVIDTMRFQILATFATMIGAEVVLRIVIRTRGVGMSRVHK